MGVGERITKAMVSSDLGMTQEAIKDADYIVAMGWVGIENGVASALWRLLHTNRRAEYDEALRITIRLTKAIDRRRGWKLKPGRAAKLAKEALDYAICPVCPSCLGRGRHTIEGTPVLGAVCMSCHGDGKRRFDSRRVGEVLLSLHDALDGYMAGVGRRIGLAREI